MSQPGSNVEGVVVMAPVEYLESRLFVMGALDYRRGIGFPSFYDILPPLEAQMYEAGRAFAACAPGYRPGDTGYAAQHQLWKAYEEGSIAP